MSLLKIPRLVLTSALLSLGGCAVGPDFQAPQAQLPTQWRDAGAGGPASARWPSLSTTPGGTASATLNSAPWWPKPAPPIPTS